MEKVITLEDALKRIQELENENAELREELEYYKNRKMSGRQKHNAKWMAIYNDFVAGYESGMTMIEIANRNNVINSRAYQYSMPSSSCRISSNFLLYNSIILFSIQIFSSYEHIADASNMFFTINFFNYSIAFSFVLLILS